MKSSDTLNALKSVLKEENTKLFRLKCMCVYRMIAHDFKAFCMTLSSLLELDNLV